MSRAGITNPTPTVDDDSMQGMYGRLSAEELLMSSYFTQRFPIALNSSHKICLSLRPIATTFNIPNDVKGVLDRLQTNIETAKVCPPPTIRGMSEGMTDLEEYFAVGWTEYNPGPTFNITTHFVEQVENLSLVEQSDIPNVLSDTRVLREWIEKFNRERNGMEKHVLDRALWSVNSMRKSWVSTKVCKELTKEEETMFDQVVKLQTETCELLDKLTLANNDLMAEQSNFQETQTENASLRESVEELKSRISQLEEGNLTLLGSRQLYKARKSLTTKFSRSD
ncbi:hypothetical protein M231_07225 [Tremella mesenterica]|uniref:Uncharacterized protein n=1 Tax=Tremella mesenterica TaxID=5217 RepID=A0A4Q1BFW7_TREME|nr:hypothetical protein M231_07225 [Tremella mesenterica]